MRSFYFRCLASSLLLLSTAMSARAEIYKWIDEQGRTHYSSNKADAERSKGSEVKIRDQAPAKVEDRSYWNYVRGSGTPEAPAVPVQANTPSAAPTRAPMLSDNGYDDGSDKAKCNIAQDVLSGALKLKNGEPFGDYERKTAVDDIRRHCR